MKEQREIDKYGNDVAGLSDTQLRLLKTLVARNCVTPEDGLSLSQLARLSEIGEVVTRRGVGNVDASTRDHGNEYVGYPSLLTRGLVHMVEFEEVRVYFLTPYGLTVCEQVEDAIAVLGPPQPTGTRSSSDTD